MSEENIREVQLSRKQLVFLFMASVVVAVAVFLLGVSVGRGVRGVSTTPAESSAAIPAPEPVAPAVMPPPTKMEGRDTNYAPSLQGPGMPSTQTAAASDSSKPPAPPPPAEDADVNEPVPAKDAAKSATSAAVMAPQSPPQKAEPAVAPKAADGGSAPKTAPPPAGSGWVVQVNAFRSRENADKEVTQLKAKGFAAFVAPSQPGSLFRVRVGPFAQRADADRAAVRLRQEGLTPSVTR